jgi:hypothetical protein
MPGWPKKRAMPAKRAVRAPDLVQLHLWDQLQGAADRPETADLPRLWQALDVALGPLTLTQQLQMAGDAVTQIAQIVEDRSLLTLEELASAGQTEGPIMPADAFSRFVRQSMRVDFEQFVAPPDRPVMAAPPRPLDPSLEVSSEPSFEPSSVAVEIDPAQLLESLPPEIWGETPGFGGLAASTAEPSLADVLSTAYVEAALTWAQTITDYLAAMAGGGTATVGWPQLRLALPLAEIELWLGLLLGEFELGRSGDQSGDGDASPVAANVTDFNAFCNWFYSPEIWVKPLAVRLLAPSTDAVGEFQNT